MCIFHFHRYRSMHESTAMFRWLSLSTILLALALALQISYAFVPPSSRLPSLNVPSYQKNGNNNIRHHTHQSSHHASFTRVIITSSTRLQAVATDTPFYVGRRNLAVAGRIPWKKLLMNKSQAKQIISIMRDETHALDILMCFILSVFPERIGKLF